ncbi:MAG: hypothetical protein AseanaTS_00940 [Candidatus Pelagadaptatus aseana]
MMPVAASPSLLWENLRFDEDYRQHFQQGIELPVWKQPLQSVPLVIGGNARLQYEYTELFEPEDGVRHEEKLLQRYTAHLDWYASERSRLFLQLIYADELDANVRPSPVDESNLQLHQGIYQYLTDALEIRLGKQEIIFGGKRLFSARDGTNVRRTHMAFRGQYLSAGHRYRLMAGSPIDNRRGSWESEVNHDERYYHLGWQYQDLEGGYYFYENDDPFVGEGTAYRHMLTLAHEQQLVQWQLNTHVFLQWGRDAEKDIQAWRYSGELVRDLGNDAELVLALDVASGGISDDKIKTFDSMYMRGSFLSELSSFTASNLITLNPHLQFDLGGGLEVKLESSLYWRYSEDDTLYNPGRRQAFSADLEDAFVGVAFAVASEWELSERFEIELNFGRLFFADDLVEQGVDHSGEIEILLDYAF